MGNCNCTESKKFNEREKHASPSPPADLPNRHEVSDDSEIIENQHVSAVVEIPDARPPRLVMRRRTIPQYKSDQDRNPLMPENERKTSSSSNASEADPPESPVQPLAVRIAHRSIYRERTKHQGRAPRFFTSIQELPLPLAGSSRPETDSSSLGSPGSPPGSGDSANTRTSQRSRIVTFTPTPSLELRM